MHFIEASSGLVAVRNIIFACAPFVHLLRVRSVRYGSWRLECRGETADMPWWAE